jgi:hypothetical protein
MEACSFVELEEFFDFTRLEADQNNGVYTIRQPQEWSSEAPPSPGGHATMDWEPTIPEAPLSVDAQHLIPSGSSEFGTLETNDDYRPNVSTTLQPSGASPDSNNLHANLAVEDALLACSIGENTMVVPKPFPSTSPVPPSTVGKNVTLQIERPESRRLPLRAEPINRKPASAKHKGRSNRIPLEARQLLEDEFSTNPYPCSWEIDIIAHQASLDTKRVRNWFNNARARKKVQREYLQ